MVNSHCIELPPREELESALTPGISRAVHHVGSMPWLGNISSGARLAVYLQHVQQL
jgi:hypothetical protein